MCNWSWSFLTGSRNKPREINENRLRNDQLILGLEFLEYSRVQDHFEHLRKNDFNPKFSDKNIFFYFEVYEEILRVYDIVFIEEN